MAVNRTTVRIFGLGPNQTVGPAYHQAQLRIVLAPILSCIFGFPVLVLLIICGLRYRAKRARKFAIKRLERRPKLIRAQGPTIFINGCQIDDEPSNSSDDTHGDKKKSRLLTVRFKPLADLDEEKTDIDMEMTSDLILTPEDSSTTFSS